MIFNNPPRSWTQVENRVVCVGGVKLNEWLDVTRGVVFAQSFLTPESRLTKSRKFESRKRKSGLGPKIIEFQLFNYTVGSLDPSLAIEQTKGRFSVLENVTLSPSKERILLVNKKLSRVGLCRKESLLIV